MTMEIFPLHSILFFSSLDISGSYSPSPGPPTPYKLKRVVEAELGRSGCLAHVDKVAAFSDVQHDGSDIAAVGLFPSGKAIKGHQRIRELSTCPCDVSDPEGPGLFCRFKATHCALGINTNSRTLRSHLGRLSGGHLSLSRRLPLHYRPEQVQVGLALYQLLRLSTCSLSETNLLAPLSLPRQMKSTSRSLSRSCRVSIPWGRTPSRR